MPESVEHHVCVYTLLAIAADVVAAPNVNRNGGEALTDQIHQSRQRENPWEQFDRAFSAVFF
jgi:hypothetical protein